MRSQDILRALLFAIFCSAGAAALGGSILCNELLRHYQNRQILKAAEESLSRLKTLNADYDALLELLKKDPNYVERIGPVTLGTERNEEETIYPKATYEQLAAAKKALTEEMSRQSAQPAIPEWLTRCSEPRRRIILFLAGAFLILISFICFGSAKQKPQKEK